MKIKTDFVTNSSSATFIMTLRTLDKNDNIDDFRLKLNTYLEKYMGGTTHSEYGPDNLRYWDASKIDFGEYGSYTFIVSEFTGMYNSRDDIPRYMRAMMVEQFLDGLKSYGFELVDFRIVHDG